MIANKGPRKVFWQSAREITRSSRKPQKPAAPNTLYDQRTVACSARRKPFTVNTHETATIFALKRYKPVPNVIRPISSSERERSELV